MKGASRQKSLIKTELMVPHGSHDDLLTDLPDRHQFTKQLHQAVAMAHRMPFALIVLGLDRFRDINHILGPKEWRLAFAASRAAIRPDHWERYDKGTARRRRIRSDPWHRKRVGDR
jgi:GGDEF domain-containing protein